MSGTQPPLSIDQGGTGASSLAAAQANLGIGGGGGGGTGTVTSVSAGGLSPVFTANVANPTAAAAITYSLSAAPANTVLGNATGGSANPLYATVTALLDSAFGSTQGGVLFRGASAWTFLAPGALGQYLESLGAGAGVQWNTPAGGGGGTTASIVTITTNATAASGTTNVLANSAGAITLTLPTSGMVVGQLPALTVTQIGAGACTIDAGAGNLINGARTFVTTGQWASVTMLATAVTGGVATQWIIQ